MRLVTVIYVGEIVLMTAAAMVAAYHWAFKAMFVML